MLMLAANALSNYVIFRAQNLRLSLIVGASFPFMDVALFVLLIELDKVAAWALIPYLLYRIYGVWWGYAVWKANDHPVPDN